MTTLTRALDLAGGGIAAVVGCGGKTSLIEHLERENRDRPTLVTPTAHMQPVERSVGVFSAATGKLGPLPEAVLEAIAGLYALTLLEADGSRGLPCKGWREDEPVIPAYVTHTIGVVTFRALGRVADETTCLRLPLFTALTGVAEGEIITPEALMRMVCGERGMFEHSVGRRYLFLNQIDDPTGAQRARQWLQALRAAHPGRFDGLLYGSLHQRRWQSV